MMTKRVPLAPIEMALQPWTAIKPTLHADQLRVGIPALALLVMFGGVFAVEPNTMSKFGLTLMLSYGIPLIFAAMAQMCIIAASDIDLGIGPYIALVSCIAVTWLNKTPILGWLLIVACIAAYIAMGALIHIRRLPAIVMTLGASFVWLGCALLLLPSPGGTTPTWLTSLLNWSPPWIPLPVLVAVLAAIFGHFLFMRSAIGVVLRGFGGNPDAVRQAGWSLIVARASLYGLAGIFGVLAGLSLAGLNTSGDATVGSRYTLISVASVIVGGSQFFGGVISPIGAVIGALIMLLTGTLLSAFDVSTSWQLSVQGGILIVVLAVRMLAERIA